MGQEALLCHSGRARRAGPRGMLPSRLAAFRDDPMASSESAGSTPKEVVLSLISHTNVGKTALARTLLRRDVGEVADSAHVTVVPEAYPLISAGDRSAMLWDTPGFGANLAKLVARLRSSENPVGWILREVWDRHRDKSLWCSQQAIRNVQRDADVVLYLVDASRTPGETGYIDLEVEVLSWIGKPVLVFLNQTGEPDPERDRRAEEEWRAHLSRYEVVREVATLDAFTRCWTSEHRLLERAAAVLEGDRAETAAELSKAWAERNRLVFEEAVHVLAGWALVALTDTEALRIEGLAEKLRFFLRTSSRSAELDRAQRRMYQTLAEETAKAVNRLIALYGLEGETASRLEEAGGKAFEVKRGVEESVAAAVGGAFSGLAGGLTADLLAGGMTFGGGAVVGMLLGGGMTFAVAKGYNFALVGTDSVRWGKSHFRAQAKFLMMLYLAVSHYGRGRGSWRDPVHNPARWEERLDRRMEEDMDRWEALWKLGGAKADRPKLEKRLRERFRETLAGVFVELYPESAPPFRR